MRGGRDWSVFGGVLLLLLRLATIGAQGPDASLGQPCVHIGPGPKCNSALVVFCVSGTCVCFGGNEPYSPHRCGPSIRYGDPCGFEDGGFPKCAELPANWLMGCVEGRCACLPGHEIHNSPGCIPQATHGQPCGHPQHTECRSDAGWNLVCAFKNGANTCICNPGTTLQPDGRCRGGTHFDEYCDVTPCEDGPPWNLRCHATTHRCVCTDDTFVNYPDDGGCKAPPVFRDPCGSPLPDCKEGVNLVCGSTGRCTCRETQMVNYADGSCKDPPVFDELCGSAFADCKSGVNLVCEANGHCACVDRVPPLVNYPDGGCKDPPIFGHPCGSQLPSCKSGVNLVCGDNGHCACEVRVPPLVNYPDGGCKDPPIFGQPCGSPLPDCKAEANLVCGSGAIRQCACEVRVPPLVNYPDGTCKDLPIFGQPCGTPLPDCKAGANLVCGSGANRQCACVDRVPPLVNYPDGGCDAPPTYGQPCGSPRPDCKSEANLVCGAARVCACRNAQMVNYPDGGCKDPPGFGDACRPPQPNCKSAANLLCGDSGLCACSSADFVQHPDKRCGAAGLLGDVCARPFILCHPKQDETHLECSGGTCQCIAGNVEHPRFVCGPPAQLHQTCDLPVCATGDQWNLACVNRECMCNPSHLEEIPAEGRCAFPAKLREDCGPPNCETGTDWNLVCDQNSHKCVCSDATVEHPGFKCGPPARFGQSCLPLPACLSTGNLACSTATSTCVCLPNFYERADLTCGSAALHAQDCTAQLPCIPNAMMECRLGKCACVGARIPATDLRSCYVPEPSKHRESCNPSLGFRCKSGVNLVCNDQLVCVCSMRWMVPGIPEGGEPGGCKVRDKSKYHEECDFDEDCDVSRNLLCKTLVRTCDCIKLHFQDPGDRTRCRRALSRYDEPCDHNGHCLQNHNMVCDPKGVCLCKPGWDLDHGVTPCKESKFGGRTYGEPCENFPVERKCVVAHNIHCVGALCACLDEYVLNEETKADPAIGVSTCRPGDGGANYKAPCEPSAITIKERCDSRQGLECERSEKQCLCAPGYIPNPNKTPGSAPCKPGERVHGQTCDPPEFLVRPRPIDPITGVPYPGPTSPPPPKFACDITKNFECFKGKCICKDETVSDRYRLEPKSGTCLITAGYGCTKNEQCFSGRCISKAEAAAESGDRGPSHDHGEKVCSGSPKVKSGGNAQIQNGILVVAATSASSMLFLKYLQQLELR